MVMSFEDYGSQAKADPNWRQEGGLPAADPYAGAAAYASQQANAPTKPPVVDLSAADPYADPAMLAFARGAGASESMARLAVQNQKSKIARQIAASGPAYQDSVKQGLQNIGGQAEANGMYESGKRLQDQNDFQVQSARQQNSWLQGLQDQSNDADVQLAQQIAQIQQQKSEQELQSRYNVALRLAGVG